MNLEVTLDKKEVARAIMYYMKSKGYNVNSLQFNTGCSYNRVLFDSQLDSWFNGVKLKVTKLD